MKDAIFQLYQERKENNKKGKTENRKEEIRYSRKKELKILKDILMEEFRVYDKEEILQLIDIYQNSLDRRLIEIRRHRDFFYSISVAVFVIIKLIPENLLLFPTITQLVGAAVILYIIMKYNEEKLISKDEEINKCSMMIKDLRELLILRNYL